MVGTIFDRCALPATLGSAMIGLPLPSWHTPAARMKSTWPPKPDTMRVPTESDTTWPVRSTSIAELIAVTLGFLRICWMSFTQLTSPMTAMD